MDNLIIVTGLPRSGTSMMMKMLEAGGIAVITDKQRQADEDNPNGYFELDQVKEIKRDLQRSAGPSSVTEAGESDLSADDNEKIREQLSSLGYM